MGSAGQTCRALERLTLKRRGEGGYDEDWLQELIDQNPSVLPVDEIEPALIPLVSVCRELPVPSGFIDNLLITPDGGLVLVETKLWRNPEARREVVGQVLDYAKDVASWSYEQLERAVRMRRGDKTCQIFHLVHGSAAGSESEQDFVDAVARNLRLGRFLLLIVGDGIQESVEQLSDYLQRHIGLHFTLSLVELSLWRIPDEQTILVQPRIITRTVQIERAVVRVEEGVAITPAPMKASQPTATPTTLSEETFYERLDRASPGTSARLKAFIAELEPLGVYPDLKGSLSLRWRAPGGQKFNLGVIDSSGRFWSEHTHAASFGIGRIDLSYNYQEQLARLIPNGSIRQNSKPTSWYLVSGDGSSGQITPRSVRCLETRHWRLPSRYRGGCR